MDDIKIENFCSPKYFISRVKRQPIEWEEIFADYLSNKGLISRVCKELLQLNNTKNLFLKLAYELRRHFFKEDIKMTNEHMNRCSMSLIIWEMKIQIIIRYQLILIRIATNKKNPKITNIGKDIEKLDL